jgi:hypothetical protein
MNTIGIIMNQKQQTFLNDNEETDEQYSQWCCDINIWSENINSLQVNHLGPRAKSFSTMLASSTMVLYDHPYFLEKYPDGFYSENIAFIPMQMYDKIKELEPLAVKMPSVNSYWNLTGLILIPFLTKMIEKKYDIIFSEEEKEHILLSATERTFRKGKIFGNDQGDFFRKGDKEVSKFLQDFKNTEIEFCSSITKEFITNTTKAVFNKKEPIFVTNEELALMADKCEMRSGKFLRNSGNDNNFIDYALLKNTDMYEKNHPFNKLMGKVKMPSKTIDLLSLDKENYKKQINDIPKSQNYILYNAFEFLTHKIVNESKTSDDLVRSVKGIWTNLALEANDKEFKMLLNILYTHCSEKFPDKKLKELTEDLKEDHGEDFINDMYKNLNFKWLDVEVSRKLAFGINENLNCGPMKREILIDAVTQFSMNGATVRTVVYPQRNNKPKI